MKRKIVLAAALLNFSTQAFGKATLFGKGATSCATAMNPQTKMESRAWVLGFWSGLNSAASMDRKNGAVGDSTDALGVIGEVELECANNPSQVLAQAVFNVYARLRQMGR